MAKGGAQVPDGVPRAKPVPNASGTDNRTDMSALPGTPGTPLPDNMTPTVPYGQKGKLDRALHGIPLDSFSPGKAGGLLGPSADPNEPVTAGIPTGPGAGPEGVLPQPGETDEKLTAQELQYAYPLIMRLATLPGATSQTKRLVQRFRSQLPVGPERMPLVPQEIMQRLQRQEESGGTSQVGQ